MAGLQFNKKKYKVKIVGRNLDDLRPLLRMFPVELVDSEPDLVISYGGDGSLLGAERDFPGVPKCPIRDMRQNPKCPRHSDMTTLEKLFAGELSETQLVKMVATTNDGNTLKGINDIVLSRKLIASAIRYRIWANGELLRSQVVADSLVVSTPFGSTGYFQSITHGNFQVGLGVAFNNAMDLYSHVIIPDNSQLTVELLRGPAVLVADNDPQSFELGTGSRLKIGISDERTSVYGLDVFRCMDCYDLRKKGIN